MKITLKKIQVKDLVANYKNNDEEGVVGYGGKLNIRPKYQREFIYKDKQRDEVIRSIQKGYPLNVMYWMKNGDGYEILDGQQRTMSICEYVSGKYSIDHKYFFNLTKAAQDVILEYTLLIYICDGNTQERIDWFGIINIAGEKLTDQELLNASYTGEWLTDAKRHFSKTNCPAHGLASDYLQGPSIRQEYLETALSWISKGQIKDYMAKHQHDTNANELWLYFKRVIDWVQATFPVYRREMKGVAWGPLYDKHGQEKLDPKRLEARISELMQDDDVSNKKGIYFYVLGGEEKHLNIRAFTPAMKRKAYEKQRGICPRCKKHFKLEEMEADHITPWHEGGKTEQHNCQMLCKDDNRRKGGK